MFYIENYTDTVTISTVLYIYCAFLIQLIFDKAQCKTETLKEMKLIKHIDLTFSLNSLYGNVINQVS